MTLIASVAGWVWAVVFMGLWLNERRAHDYTRRALDHWRRLKG